VERREVLKLGGAKVSSPSCFSTKPCFQDFTVKVRKVCTKVTFLIKPRLRIRVTALRMEAAVPAAAARDTRALHPTEGCCPTPQSAAPAPTWGPLPIACRPFRAGNCDNAKWLFSPNA